MALEEQIREILCKYAERITTLEQEYRRKIQEMQETEQETEWETRIRDEKEDVEMKICDETRNRLEPLLDEVVFEPFDSCTPWSGMGFRHSYIVYKVGVKKTNDVRKVIVFFAEFHEADI